MLTYNQPKTICHKGIVRKNETKSVMVVINAHSACSGCHAEGNCTLAGNEEKVIEVDGFYDVQPGDEVTIQINQSTGFAAVILAYLVPIVVVIATLITLLLFDMSELLAGILSIAVLLPYFTILLLFRKRINERFIFTLNDNR